MKTSKTWKYHSPSKKLINTISNQFQVSKTLALLLINRGLTDPVKIDAFLKPTLAQLFNPFHFRDLPKAISRLRQAIDRKENVLIYGDRDVDGITSTTILLNTLNYFKLSTYYKIPGSREGYGINKSVIDEYIKRDVKLIITVDCGISNIEEVKYAKSLGVDVIITDHHEPSEHLPEAVAILNPKIKDSGYPFKNLAGVGVTLKLMQGLLYSYHPDFNKVFSIIDFETTGFSPSKDEIIEVAVYKIKNNRIIDKFQRLVKPSIKLPGIITKITGITQELLDKEGEPPEKVIPELFKFVDGTIFVAHNANFDWRFYEKYVEKYLNKKIDYEIIDTIPLLRSQFPGLSSLKLEAVADFMNIKTPRFHRAENDVYVLHKVFVELRKLRYPAMVDVFKYLDFVSLGTIADMVPLTSENRILAALGLTKIAFTKNVGLRTLYSLLNLDKKKEIAENEIGWLIAPIINAAGRIETGDIALKLLLTIDKKETLKIAQTLLKLNQLRKERTEDNLNKVLALIKDTYNQETDKVIIVKSSEIEHGVTGIVATKIKNEYYRPTFILIEDKDCITGAARSIKGYNIIDVLRKAEKYLTQFGGHEYAAGFTLKKESLDGFIQTIKDEITNNLTDDMLKSVLEIDMEIEFDRITNKLLNEFDYLRPFGIENPRPKFITRDVEVLNINRYGHSNEHLKLRLRKKNKYFNAVGWNMGYFSEIIERLQPMLYNIVYSVIRNEFMDRSEILLTLEDLKYDL